MKKLALTILITLLSVNIVSAFCDKGNGNPEFINSMIANFFGIFFISSYLLTIPIIFLYVLRERVGMWTIVSALSSLVLFIPLLIFEYSLNPCDATIGFIITVAEFVFMLFLFTFQLVSCIKQRSRLKAKLP
jgi:hypothetical protein